MLILNSIEGVIFMLKLINQCSVSYQSWYLPHSKEVVWSSLQRGEVAQEVACDAERWPGTLKGLTDILSCF